MLGKIEGRRRRSRRQEIETHLMDVRAGQLKRLRAKELMPASQLNCDAEEDF